MSARVVTLLRFSLLLAPIALLPMTSCRSGGGGVAGNQLADALIACGLLGPGQLPAAANSSDPYDNCVNQCIAGSTCAELENMVCEQSLELREACELQCRETNGFACADGGKLDPTWQCDGIPDCVDGSDELDCPPAFACGDGSEIAPVYHCDGESDCATGSDEVGCPAVPTFTCADASQVPATSRCDFEQNCTDGSDEVGCAMIMCPGA